MDNAHHARSKQAILPIFEKELRYRIAICLKNSGGTRELTDDFKKSLCEDITLATIRYPVSLTELEAQIKDLERRKIIKFHAPNVATLTNLGVEYVNTPLSNDSLDIYW